MALPFHPSCPSGSVLSPTGNRPPLLFADNVLLCRFLYLLPSLHTASDLPSACFRYTRSARCCLYTSPGRYTLSAWMVPESLLPVSSAAVLVPFRHYFPAVRYVLHVHTDTRSPEPFRLRSVRSVAVEIHIPRTSVLPVSPHLPSCLTEIPWMQPYSRHRLRSAGCILPSNRLLSGPILRKSYCFGPELFRQILS